MSADAHYSHRHWYLEGEDLAMPSMAIELPLDFPELVHPSAAASGGGGSGSGAAVGRSTGGGGGGGGGAAAIGAAAGVAGQGAFSLDPNFISTEDLLPGGKWAEPAVPTTFLRP